MNNEAEIFFLKDILAKCRVPVRVISPAEPAEILIAPCLRDLTGLVPPPQITVREYLGKIEPVTRYTFADAFRCRHICMLLPDREEESLLLIGPYLGASLSAKELLELGESMGIPPASQSYFGEYYASLSAFPGNDCFFAVLDTFCERLWHSPSFAVVDVNHQSVLPFFSLHTLTRGDAAGDIAAKVALMETRYAFENDLIQAVALGRQHKTELLMSALEEYSFEMRTADPLRNAKNYSVIMNTLLRKAAETGGVHPLYIDRISSKFAERIENSTSLRESTDLMKEMLSAYCRLVYNHSIRKYSPIVQKTILTMDADLSADLTLHTLAARQDISPGYLATLFKKETGKTVSGYVWEKRIYHADYLLKNTNLQIQTVASRCGVMDVQYFSKMFKKLVGKTPREYRASLR